MAILPNINPEAILHNVKNAAAFTKEALEAADIPSHLDAASKKAKEFSSKVAAEFPSHLDAASEKAKAFSAKAAADIPAHLADAIKGAKTFSRQDAAEAAKLAANWVGENPGTASTYTVIAVGSTVAIVAPAALASPALGILGFGSGGPVKFMFAPVIQSKIIKVKAARRAFAVLQSAAMSGYGVPIVNAIVRGGGIAAALGAGGHAGARAFQCSPGYDPESQSNPNEGTWTCSIADVPAETVIKDLLKEDEKLQLSMTEEERPKEEHPEVERA